MTRTSPLPEFSRKWQPPSTKAPYYHLVPKTIRENLIFRQRMIELGNQSKENADDLWQMCARDMWFWTNVFVLTYDPRLPAGRRKIPMITNGDQDRALWAMTEAVRMGAETGTGIDVATEKSRGTGGTWINLLKIAHEFQFVSDGSFLLGSRKEDLVDKPDEPDSLFWKTDFIFENQPSWLRPMVDRTYMKCLNLENGSVITGESSNPDFGRGGRKSIILLDEFAKVPEAAAVNTACSAAANTRFFNSTHAGVGSEFNRICDSVRPEFRIRLHWSGFEAYRGGLCWGENGEISSDWYKSMCRKLPGPIQIKAELDICPIGSEALYFDAEMLKSIEVNDCREPLLVGELLYDPMAMPTKFLPTPQGRLKLWIPIDVNGLPPQGSYKFGSDICAGSGASNSATNGYDQKSKIQVVELVHSRTSPDEFARYSIALCRWFGRDKDTPSELIWEANGPGVTFAEEVYRQNFNNIYFSQDENKITKDRTERAGWFPTQANKERMLGEFAVALKSREFICRSLELVRELGTYVYKEGRKIEPRDGNTEIDPSGARSNHGDRVIGAGLSFKAGVASGKIDEEIKEPELIYGTTAWHHSIHYKNDAKTNHGKLYPFYDRCQPKTKGIQ